ncbi:Lrp/AsnC family transcriptional regulator [Cerasicoccus arenae]|uniref:ArsR family transcriptional regulator n=1 Tax=Cerasicoccus arenae TaxID=424488 RepID=A0A8J3DCY2_9BACT|nr:Lrp/AsnC family transcriptional regulator [Cerasicoccus arenae]MBK1857743.1 Lrp/AsnC family transcriptional regulator [Cerasicoccus arenae]GHB91064.1 ArsR family transcriptional regulator [Cerasicoccus arenae]
MNPVLKLILDGEPLTTAQMGKVLDMSREQIDAELEKLRAEGILLGWRPILNPDYSGPDEVRAVIEVKISPEREGGFDRIAERISKFDRVESCYLMSGAYDLLVVIKAQNLQRVASFVFEKLATVAGVNSTATHFMLRAYKEQGHYIARPEEVDAKPAVSP